MPLQTCPGTALRQLSALWGTAWTALRDSPYSPEAKEKAVAARAVLYREHKETCSIMQRGSQTCFRADRCVLPPATFVSWQECWHPGDRLVIPLLCLLASFPQLLHWFFSLHFLLHSPFTTISNLLTSEACWAIHRGLKVCPHPCYTRSWVYLKAWSQLIGNAMHRNIC